MGGGGGVIKAVWRLKTTRKLLSGSNYKKWSLFFCEGAAGGGVRTPPSKELQMKRNIFSFVRCVETDCGHLQEFVTVYGTNKYKDQSLLFFVNTDRLFTAFSGV